MLMKTKKQNRVDFKHHFKLKLYFSKLYVFCKKLFIMIPVSIILLLIFLFLIEGFLGWSHLLINIVKNNKNIAEEIHTEYDPLLGWINKKNIFLPNMYGPGIFLSTNEDRFRKTTTNPNSKSLVTICTGDSFTLGYGVDDKHTWCSLLSKDKLQTINMGQGGYGIDQNYLWYQRDAGTIQHTFHIMAFIVYDFDRALTDNFLGYSKPYLKIENNLLVNTDYPVPKPQQWKRILLMNKDTINKLNTFQAIEYLLKRVNEHNHQYELSNEDSENIIETIFENLIKLTQERYAVPIVVLLPSEYSTEQKGIYMKEYYKRKDFLELMSQKYNYTFLDMGEYMFTNDQDMYNSYFIANNGHYTESTNELVSQKIANVINEYLLNHPELEN